MSSNPPDADGSRGSIVLISSVAGYFGKSGVVAYIASKHGVIGLMRASQAKASELDVRINAIAPSFTPSHMTAGFSAQWEEKGLPANSVEDVAKTIVEASTDPERKGHGMLVSLCALFLGLTRLIACLTEAVNDGHDVCGRKKPMARLSVVTDMHRVLLVVDLIGHAASFEQARSGKRRVSKSWTWPLDHLRNATLKSTEL
jgi:hypothetical protein